MGGAGRTSAYPAGASLLCSTLPLEDAISCHSQWARADVRKSVDPTLTWLTSRSRTARKDYASVESGVAAMGYVTQGYASSGAGSSGPMDWKLDVLSAKLRHEASMRWQL